jgi:RNA ligase (TIGR02306 family)
LSEFSVRVVRISEPVVDHPNADRLSLIQIGGYTCIAAKKEDGSHLYKEGDHVVYVPEGAVVPDWLLKKHGFWNEEKGKGLLSGSGGNKVRARLLRDIFSQGILLPTRAILMQGGYWQYRIDGETHADGSWPWVGVREEGEDVAEFLGITKYEPTIPAYMAGEVAHVPGAAVKFDFESIQKSTRLFNEEDFVEATEKLHGTCFQFGYVPGLNHPEMFFDGNIYCCSKGLGKQDLVFKNNEKNDRNVYVRTLRALLDAGLGEKLKEFTENYGQPFRVFGEIFGAGVQDLSYGTKTPEFKAFDLRIGEEFLAPTFAATHLDGLGLERVPVLYRGPFIREKLLEVRDGLDYSGTHIREGIVIRSDSNEWSGMFGRKIGKWVSPAYLLRKGGSELQ